MKTRLVKTSFKFIKQCYVYGLIFNSINQFHYDYFLILPIFDVGPILSLISMTGEALVVTGAGGSDGWLRGVSRIEIETSVLAEVFTILTVVAVSLITTEGGIF
jgi:hypothetical protein